MPSRHTIGFFPLVLLAFATAAPTMAQAPCNDPDLLGAYFDHYQEFNDYHRDIDKQGDLLVYVKFRNLLCTADVSDPANVTPIDELSGAFRDSVAIFGDYIAVERDDATDKIVVYSHVNGVIGPQVAEFAPPQDVRFFREYGSLVVVRYTNAGIDLVDFGDPTNPTLLANIPTPGGSLDFALYADRLYLVTTTGDLETYDISNPAAPSLIASAPLPVAQPPALFNQNSPFFVVNGTTGFFTKAESTTGAGDSAFVSLDLSNPASPAVLSSLIPPTGQAFKTELASLQGDTAYVNGTIGDRPFTFIINTANTASATIDGIFPRNPTYTRASVAYGWAGLDYYDGDTAYLSNDYGFRIVDLCTLNTDPTPFLKYGAQAAARDVQIVGDLAYVAASSRGLQVLQLSDIAAPVRIGSATVPNNKNAINVVVKGTTAYVKVDEPYVNFAEFDVTDPTNPTFVSKWESDYTGLQSRSFDVDNDTLYVPASRLRIYDISSPALSLLAEHHFPSRNLKDLHYIGNSTLLAVADQHAMVINVSDLNNIMITAETQLAGIETLGATFAPDRMYVADMFDGFSIVDFSDLNNPSELSHVTTGAGSDTAPIVVGDRLYFHDLLSGLQVYDISDEANPVLMSSHVRTTDEFVTGLAVRNDTAYTAAQLDGVHIVEFCQPANPCPADVNGDGILDNGDIGVFVGLFLAGDITADFNADGILDNGDIGAFVAAYLAGC